MADTIWGNVIRVVDGDTFDVQVTHYSPQNRIRYNNTERIRLASVNAPELTSLLGVSAKQQLGRRISGRFVRLTVHTRDIYGRLVCDVSPETRT